jgi:hypothetical protein
MATALTGEPPPDRKHAVSLMRIRQAQCRFIISEPAQKPIFCGAPTDGGSWCLGTDASCIAVKRLLWSPTPRLKVTAQPPQGQQANIKRQSRRSIARGDAR